jgi:hypothetical protein
LKQALQSPSISSEISQSSEDKLGFRAAEAWVRPSPIITNGQILQYGFDLKKCVFSMRLLGEKKGLEQEAATEIYLPDFHFPDTHTVISVSGGEWTIDYSEIHSVKFQRLRWWHPEGDHNIKIQGVKRKPGDPAVSGEELSYLEQCQKGGCSMM